MSANLAYQNRETRSLRRPFLAILLCSSSLWCASNASAQSAQPEDGASEVEDIIVTARRRSESLQDVPIAVSVVSGATLREQNLNNVPELISIIPALTLRPSSTKDTGLLIRGLGTITTSPGAEPTVSMLLDGVVLSRPGQMVAELIDIERVEVLRGPQGTLFGKNASAGVINITTNAPVSGTSGHVEASYFTGDEYRISAVLNGEIAPGLLSVRLSGLTSHYGGGGRNIVTGSKVGGRNSDGFRLKFLFTPNDNLRILLSTDYLKSNTSSVGVVYVGTRNIAYPSGVLTDSQTLRNNLADEGITPSLRNRETSSEIDGGYRDKFYGGSAQIDYSLGDYDLTSITGYRGWRGTQIADSDGFATLAPTRPNQLQDFGTVDSTQFTQEIRLASPKGFIDYVLGLYYFHANNRETYRRDVTQLVGGARISNSGLNRYSTVSNNYSIFGEGNVNLSESLRLIAGARLVRDELRFQTNRISTSMTPLPGVQPGFAAEGSTAVTDYAARLGVQFDLNEEVKAYATYSRGYKGPAFNTFFNMLARDTIALNPETSDAFELGLKASLLDRRLIVNLALFDDQVANYQANQPDVVAGTIVTRLINAGDVSTRGVEMEVIGRIAPNFTVNVDYAYVDAKIDKFNCPPGAAVSCNVDGMPLPYAPKHKLSLRSDYSTSLSSSLELNLSGNYTYQTKQQNSISQTPLTVAPAYGLLNLSFGITDMDSGWQVRVLVRNALNKFYRSSYSQANGGVFAGLPRDFERYAGLTLRKEF